MMSRYTENPPDIDACKPAVSLLFAHAPKIYMAAAREPIMKRIALYLRVSTSKQDTKNQRRELEAVAARSGWEIVRVFQDNGISGAKSRDERPGLDAMLKAVNAREFDNPKGSQSVF
jgi:predicted site-specific integrase-resolvase